MTAQVKDFTPDKEVISPFISETYTPNRDIVKSYHMQAALYLSTFYGYDYATVLELVEKVFVPSENGFKEALFGVFKKNKYGDRVNTVMKAREFFATVEQNNWILSPSLVAYKHTDEEQAVNAIGTDTFIEFRRLYKGKKKQAIDVGDHEAEVAFHEIQNALKIFNNAQSGGMSSSGTPLYNKSGHTTLTSTCRAVTSTANLLNERLITGNRLLLSYDKTMELFLSTLGYANRELIQQVIDEYSMNYATVDQVWDMVLRCTSYYWHNPTQLQAVKSFLQDLTPLELTILLCSMDLRGLYTTNKDLMKRFFNDWCELPTMPEGFKVEDGVKPANSDYEVLIITKLGKKPTKEQAAFLNKHHLMLEQKWGSFIKAFLKAEIPPSSLFSVKELVRENVLTSDTDSMIYSIDMIIDDYVSDIQGGMCFNAAMTYFIRCIAVDQHARLSQNMNVARRYRNRLNMKNEYLFSSYVTTSMSKHYYAMQLMLEGILREVPELELKGVHLKGVKIALKVREFTNRLMRDVLDAIYNKRKLDPASLLAEIADIERALFADIAEGGYAWLTKNGIKAEEAYANPESSIYYYHELWENVFAAKYGSAPELPYRAYKVNLALHNKTKVKRFFDTLEDKEFGKIFHDYIEQRANLTSVYIPVDMIDGMGGIPKELLDIVDTRLLIQQNFKSIYAILESLGLYFLNAKATRLVSDEH
jgi:DNA polymerase elongation subunit (family B)